MTTDILTLMFLVLDPSGGFVMYWVLQFFVCIIIAGLIGGDAKHLGCRGFQLWAVAVVVAPLTVVPVHMLWRHVYYSRKRSRRYSTLSPADYGGVMLILLAVTLFFLVTPIVTPRREQPTRMEQAPIIRIADQFWRSW